MIQDTQVEGTEGNPPENATDTAEFDSAWDDLGKDDGQPSDDAEGRQLDEAEEGQGDADEAGQGADEDATPYADAGGPAATETSDDIWANAAPELKAAYAAETEGRKKAENLVRSNGGRLAQALNQLAELQAKLESKRDEGGATDEGAEASNPEERLQQLRDEYPEVAAPILDQMAKLEATVSELKAGAQSKGEADLQTLEAEQAQALTDLHSDWQTVVQSPEYISWLDGQPQAIQRVVRTENAQKIVNAEDCALVLDLFKQSQAGAGDEAESLADKRKRQLKSGIGVSGRQPQVIRDEDGGYDDEWDRLSRKEAAKEASNRRR